MVDELTHVTDGLLAATPGAAVVASVGLVALLLVALIGTCSRRAVTSWRSDERRAVAAVGWSSLATVIVLAAASLVGFVVVEAWKVLVA